jgi:hypothetical protein
VNTAFLFPCWGNGVKEVVCGRGERNGARGALIVQKDAEWLLSSEPVNFFFNASLLIPL